MAGKAVLPTGIENFEEMRTRGYYYADKTGLIRDLIKNMGKVNYPSETFWENAECKHAEIFL